MSGNYLTEAFKELECLNEDVFSFDDEGAEKLKLFMDGDTTDEFVDVIDPEAENEEDLKDSYVGKVILHCSICGSDMYKDPSEVIVDEEKELANVGEECPMCMNPDGYTIVGEVAEYKEDEHEEESESESEEEIENKEEVEVEESLTEAKDLTKIEGTIASVLSKMMKDIPSDATAGEIKRMVYKALDDSDIADKKAVDIFKRKLENAKGVNAMLSTIAAYTTGITKDTGKKAPKNERLTLKSKKSNINESSKRDDIDADADDKKEKAKATFMKKKDDADADKDYKLKKAGMKEPDQLKESDEPAALSIEDAQKWVDYDMKRYGKISDRTNRLVNKAGFQILKDDHGDYEVAAGKFESMNEESEEKWVQIRLNSPNENKYCGYGGRSWVTKDSEGVDTWSSKEEAIEDGKKNYKKTFRYGKEWDVVKLEESLKEDFEKVDIETDREKMSMTADEDGKVTVTTEPKHEEHEDKEEYMAPVSPEVKDEIEKDSMEDEEIDIDEFDEESFDELGESYLKKVYDNVASYKTTSAKINGNSLMLEGVITFNSGKSAKTQFLFESSHKTTRGKLKFTGVNKQITESTKSFIITGSMEGKKLLTEALTYNYRVKGQKDRIYGTIRK